MFSFHFYFCPRWPRPIKIPPVIQVSCIGILILSHFCHFKTFFFFFTKKSWWIWSQSGAWYASCESQKHAFTSCLGVCERVCRIGHYDRRQQSAHHVGRFESVRARQKDWHWYLFHCIQSTRQKNGQYSGKKNGSFLFPTFFFKKKSILKRLLNF